MFSQSGSSMNHLCWQLVEGLLTFGILVTGPASGKRACFCVVNMCECISNQSP